MNSNLIAKHFDAIKYNNTDPNKEPISNGNANFSEWLNTLKKRITGEGWNSHPGIIDVLGRSQFIMQERITRSRMAGDPPDVYFNPHLEKIGMLEFDRAQEAIDEGYNIVYQLRENIERNIHPS